MFLNFLILIVLVYLLAENGPYCGLTTRIQKYISVGERFSMRVSEAQLGGGG